MKPQTISITLAAALLALGAGCASSSDPYAANRNQTAKGAAGGAAAGAIIGGIIGNNSEHGNTEKGAAIGAVAGGIAGGAIAHRQEERQTAATRSQESVYSGGYSVQSIPPSPVSEPQEYPSPQPSANAVWIRGHYSYTGNGYQWEPGRWEVPPAGARTYVQPSWQPAANGGYVYVRGHWQ